MGRWLLSSDSAGGACSFLLSHQNEPVWERYSGYESPVSYRFRSLLKLERVIDGLGYYLPDF